MKITNFNLIRVSAVLIGSLFLFTACGNDTDNMRVLTTSERVEMYIANGNAHYIMGQYEDAIEQYDLAINTDRDYPPPYNQRGLAKFALGDIEGAILDYYFAIEKGQEGGVVHANIGVALLNNRSYDEALLAFDRAIMLGYTELPVFSSRGFTHFVLEDFEAAFEDYNRVIETFGAMTVDAYSNRALAYIELGMYQEATDDCLSAINAGLEADMDAENGQSYFICGLAYERLESEASSRIFYDKAIERGYNPTGQPQP